MDDYINIQLRKGLSSIDFHFYSFFDGTAHEIANYMFDKIEGVLEYRSPSQTDEDGNKLYTDMGRLNFTIEGSPTRGWFKDGLLCDTFKFAQLMESTLSQQNIALLNQKEGQIMRPYLYPDFVGIKVKSRMPNLEPDAYDDEVTIFPSTEIANMSLFEYNSYKTIDAEAYGLDMYDTHLDGLAVTFTDFGFKAVRLPDGTVYEMDSMFYPFEFGVFDGGSEDEQA